MKKILCSFCLWFCFYALPAQSNFEIQEFTGTIISIEPGFRLAYEELYLEVEGIREHFTFYPEYGQLILSKVQKGDLISLRAKVDLRKRDEFKKLSDEKQKKILPFHRSFITEIKLGNEWFALKEPEKIAESNYVTKSFLDQKVVEVYTFNNVSRALRVTSGAVTYSPGFLWSINSLEAIKEGDVISFSGWQSIPKPGFQYPVQNVSDLYSFHRLTKKAGILKSHLYKQNYVCIGLKFASSEGEFSVSFPSDRAKEIINFVKQDETAVFYFYDYKIEGQLDSPELHAIVQRKDTLYINRIGFYGGADVKHDHTTVTVSGKIKEIVRSNRGRIISLLMNSDCYVEMDSRFEKQIGSLLKRGVSIEIRGDERIKKEGEVYSKNYRIIMPQQISIDGKVYTLNQLP